MYIMHNSLLKIIVNLSMSGMQRQRSMKSSQSQIMVVISAPD